MGRGVTYAASAINLITIVLGLCALGVVICADDVERPVVAAPALAAAKADDDDPHAMHNSLMDEMQVIIPTERPVIIPPSELINPKRQVAGEAVHNDRPDKQRVNNEHPLQRPQHNNHEQQSNLDEPKMVDHVVIDDGLSFFHGFVASLSVILVSELGDKTFFIAAIMAMRHSRVTVFTGAIAALALMTVLSAVFGMAANLIPKIYTYYISTMLFVIFGLKMLRDGCRMSDAEAQEEFDEVQMDLKKREDEYENRNKIVMVETSSTAPLADGPDRRTTVRRLCFCLFPLHVVVQAFTMTFLAEWGDRSQLTTIILAARENVPGVIIGGVLGHSLCTGLAVIGGRMIAQRISVKTVTIVGGVVFLIFAFTALLFNNPHE